MEQIERWLSTVTAQLRFPPDRQAVRQELADHLEDRQAGYLLDGMTAEEAEKAAVRAMGDPQLVGRALNRAHRPAEGWLWLCSKILAIFMAVVLGLFLLGESDRFDTLWRRLREDYLETERCCYDLSETYPSFAAESRPVSSDAVMRVGGYTMTLDHGYYFESQGLYEEYLTLCFWVRGEYPWDGPPLGLRNVVIADDSGGLHRPGVTSECRLECVDGVPGLWKVHLRVFLPGGVHTQSPERQWFRVSLEGTGLEFKVYTDGEVTA